MTADRAALAEALRLEDQTERLLEVAAIVSEALEPLGIHPVLVGGLAVAYWTAGAYVTGDIDVVMPYLPEIDERLAELGFERRGRFWLLREGGVVFEAPGSGLAAGEEAQAVELASGRAVAVLTLEDLLVGRIHEFVGTGHSDRPRSGAHAARARKISTPADCNGEPTRRQSSKRSVSSRVSPSACGEGAQLEQWELHELPRGGYAKRVAARKTHLHRVEAATRTRAEAWVEQVLRSLPTRRRQRPRDPEEAALLREIGTPEELIGPVRAREGGPEAARRRPGCRGRISSGPGAGSYPAGVMFRFMRKRFSGSYFALSSASRS